LGLKYRGWDNREERIKTQKVQREAITRVMNTPASFFVNDLENP